MGNRQTINRVLTVVGISVAALTPAPSAAASTQDIVMPRPSVAAVHNTAELTVTWVFRGEDLFACETVAYDLRRIIGEYGGRVDVRAIRINADDELVASFLRKERLPIRVASMSAAQYHQAYQTENSPAVFINRGGQRLRSYFASDAPRTGQRSSLDLYAVVGQLLAHPAHTLARAQ
jgi:hypothetical protein